MTTDGESLDADGVEREATSTDRDVTESADAAFHFETGRGLADGLGYGPGDLCGSGMDASIAGVYVTETCTATGIDVTDEQVEKDADLRAARVGEAARIGSYTSLVETAGGDLQEVRENTQYEFIPGRGGERMPERRREERLAVRLPAERGGNIR